MDRSEDIARDFKWYLDQTLVSLGKKPTGKKWSRRRTAKIQPLVDIVKKYADAVTQGSWNPEIHQRGMSDRRQELAAEADVSLRDSRRTLSRKLRQQIAETEKAMDLSG